MFLDMRSACLSGLETSPSRYFVLFNIQTYEVHRSHRIHIEMFKPNNYCVAPMCSHVCGKKKSSEPHRGSDGLHRVSEGLKRKAFYLGHGDLNEHKERGICLRITKANSYRQTLMNFAINITEDTLENFTLPKQGMAIADRDWYVRAHNQFTLSFFARHL